MRACLPFLLAACSILMTALTAFGKDDRSRSPAARARALRHFERRVRPLLARRCQSCHGARKQSSGLRLDTAMGVRQGGDSGRLLVEGKPASSLIIRAVRRRGNLKMPPKGPLSEREIRDLERWVAEGAPWPKTGTVRKKIPPAKDHRKSKTAPPLTPNDPRLARSLQLWLKADSFRLRDGQAVTVWPDQSGHGRDLTATKGIRLNGAGKPPIFVSASLVGGQPAVRFGTESGLAASPDNLPSIRGNAAATIVVVCRLKPNNGRGKFDAVLCIGDPTGQGRNPGAPWAFLIEVERDGNPDRHQLDLAGGWSHDASLGPGSASPLYRSSQILTVTKTPGPMAATTRFHFNGVGSAKAVGRLPRGATGVPDIRYRRDVGVHLGKAANWSGSFSGDVAEVIVYNRALSDDERRGLESHLLSKYQFLRPDDLARARRSFTAAEKDFWSFRPVRRFPLPAVGNRSWPANGIDRFILHRLEESGLTPAAPADRATLLRRATFNLTGLPPSPHEQNTFINDPANDSVAYARVVDRLLASPRFGERWARHWLDVVRYADTTANDGNFVMRFAYRYRDYVIRAFNSDKPYDRFIVDQLAGDLATGGNSELMAERTIATGFLMIGPKALAETDKEQVKMDIVDEQIDVTTRAFLGLTVACARCHDHKFDPIPTVDYYSLAGIFRSTEIFKDLTRNASMWMEFPVSLRGKRITVMAPREGRARHLRVHRRGNRFQLGDIAPRRFLQVLAGEGHAPITGPSSGRLQLARWIASRSNPLTARVMVNRIWQGHFGRGLVATSDNFGVRGELPTHPRLLDWLAHRFMHSGWSMKDIHRLILLSSTYRMSSRANTTARARDPNNRLLSRMPRRRLDAEQIRDSLLLLGGRLRTKMFGGALVMKVYEQGEAIDRKRGVVSASKINSSWPGFLTPRRSLYLPVVRNGQPDLLALFDVADANAVTPRRSETTVASQTSFLLNNPFVRRQSLYLARRVIRERDNDAHRVDLVYRLALGRAPDTREILAARRFLGAATSALRNALKSPPEEAREAAWQNYCQIVLCLNEFLYLD